MVAHEAKPSPGRDEGDPDKPDRWIKTQNVARNAAISTCAKAAPLI